VAQIGDGVCEAGHTGSTKKCGQGDTQLSARPGLFPTVRNVVETGCAEQPRRKISEPVADCGMPWYAPITPSPRVQEFVREKTARPTLRIAVSEGVPEEELL
jgi:hypothetical protein